MADRRLRLRLGLFVALALVTLAALVVIFGRAPTLFSNRAPYVVLFPEAPGIAVGTPVRKSGVRIGDVTQLDLDASTGEVRVSIEVDKRYVPRTGEDAVISRGLLSGDTALDFVPKLGADGNPLPRGEPLPHGSEIRGIAPVSTRALLTQAQEAIPTAQESMARVQQSFQRIEKAIPKIEKAADEFAATNKAIQDFLGADPNQPTAREMLREIIALLKAVKPVADDVRALIRDNGPEVARLLRTARESAEGINDLVNPDNRKAVSNSLKNIQIASDDLTKTIRLVALLADQAEKTLRELNARLVQSGRVLGNLDKLTGPLGENATDLSADVRGIAKNLNIASGQLSVTLTEAQATLKALNRSDGTFTKLLTDPMLYNNLSDATAGATRVLLRVERIAKDLEVFADKIARKPETLGVGGALRPNAGLKESPTAPLAPHPGPTPTQPQAPPIVTPFPPVSSYKPPVPNDRPPPP
jgi:phospholipid/cholesterol/gamma-HCH transport system substrate-binding protein